MNLFKTIFRGLVFTLLLAGFVNAQTFEGKITFEATDKGEETQQIEYYVQGDNYKMSFPGEQGGEMLFKGDDLYVVMHQQKMYMQIPASVQEDTDYEADEMAEKFTYENTGETKEILGYDCEKWIVGDENSKVVVWATDEIGSFKLFEAPMFDQEDNPFTSGLKGKFPMVFTEFDASGNEMSTLKVVDISQAKLDASEFEVPADYNKMDMGKMNKK